MHIRKPSLFLAILAGCSAHLASAATWVGTESHGFKGSGLAGEQALSPANELAAGTPVNVSVHLKARNAALLDSMVNAILSGNGGRLLSRSESASLFAPTDAQVQSVAAHLRRAGFVNITVSPDNFVVSASGSAGTVRSAFQTALHRATLNGRSGMLNAGDVQVPATLAGTVLSVQGLQTLHGMHNMMRLTAMTPQPLSLAPQAATRGQVAGHNPMDFSRVYGGSASTTGSATVVGIIAAGNVAASVTDLQRFTTANKLAAIPVSVIHAGASGGDTSGVIEWSLDSQSLVGASGGRVKQVNFYVATSFNNADITAAYRKAVSDNAARVINVSLGECEDYANWDGTRAAADQVFKLGIVQGQTFVVSSGDSGSNECGNGSTHQSYPAVSPYVVSVGGTTLSTTAAGDWVSESTWTYGGGGASATEVVPSWQPAVVKGARSRAVPDLAFDGDPYSGAIIYANGQLTQVGGTSLSAPILTGILARAQSANGNRLGFPLVALYKYAPTNATVFHDVTAGSNGAYRAGAGWDYTTGFGSLVIPNYLKLVGSKTGF